MTAETPVLCEIDARGVATVRLNRPHRNNAYNGEMLQALVDGMAALEADASVRVIVLRGNGPHFQAGADLSWLKQINQGDAQANLAASRLTGQAVRVLNESSKPTVALVHGSCVGGGTGVVAACDVVIAEETANFAISEARWGLAATIIFPQLNEAIGLRNVRRFALTCERFDAARAMAMGLVHEVCAPGSLDAAARPVIDGLLQSAPGAIAVSKRSAMSCAGAIMSDALFDRLVAEHSAKRQSAEATDGLASFAEKRSPGWVVR
jgi:methylglutaconyl-CoA hydratase